MRDCMNKKLDKLLDQWIADVDKTTRLIEHSIKLVKIAISVLLAIGIIQLYFFFFG